MVQAPEAIEARSADEPSSVSMSETAKIRVAMFGLLGMKNRL
jgi:hypothetical protein